MKQKILIIEDEEKIVKILRIYLEAENFEVDFSLDGKEGFEKSLVNEYDLIILDLMLPSMPGEKIASELKKLKDLPILMLTAKDKEDERIQGFLSGADDYVLKPFSPKEVVLRVQAILKRYRKGKKSPLITYKDIQIDEERFSILVDNEPVQLTKAEFKIIHLLISKPGIVFSRSRLMDEITDDSYVVSERTIDTHVKNLRKKIKKDYIKTVFGMGYKFE